MRKKARERVVEIELSQDVKALTPASPISEDHVTQVIPHDGYLIYVTSDGTLWRTFDPMSGIFEVMPLPMGSETMILSNKKLNHAKKP